MVPPKECGVNPFARVVTGARVGRCGHDAIDPPEAMMAASTVNSSNRRATAIVSVICAMPLRVELSGSPIAGRVGPSDPLVTAGGGAKTANDNLPRPAYTAVAGWAVLRLRFQGILISSGDARPQPSESTTSHAAYRGTS
jgi:hypothetical protein